MIKSFISWLKRPMTERDAYRIMTRCDAEDGEKGMLVFVTGDGTRYAVEASRLPDVCKYTELGPCGSVSVEWWPPKTPLSSQ